MWREDVEETGIVFLEYYESFFTSSNPIVSADLLDAIHSKVSAHMNSLLIRDFRADEVERALKQMFPTTALGPNEMPPFFYQQFWPIVGNVMTKTVLDFLNAGIIPHKFNETHIVLIPKVKDPKQVQEFRSISLCNVAYKLASKTLANQLKLFLPNIVCEN